MEKSKQTLTDRVAKLEQTAADHARRITALEAQPDQKPKQQAAASSLDEALNDFNEFLNNFHGLD